MFMVFSTTKTIECVDKVQKDEISMCGCLLTNLRSTYDAFDFSYQSSAMNSDNVKNK